MSFDCCREFGFSSGGLCSEVLLCYHASIGLDLEHYISCCLYNKERFVEGYFGFSGILFL